MAGEGLPRVLLVSVNPLSETSNNGKTYLSFFRGYPSNRLAQLYFHRESPSSDVCTNYYRISDEDVMNYLLRRSSTLGSVVTPKSIQATAFRRANSVLKGLRSIRLIRGGILTGIPVRQGLVRQWITDFAPEVIFFCGGNATYLYNKVLEISEYTRAPIVNFITDDYILPRGLAGPSDSVHRAWTRRATLRLSSLSALNLTIGRRMAVEYKLQYGIDSSTIMNLVEIQDRKPVDETSKPIRFTYLGGLHSNRWQTLAKLADSIRRVSASELSAELHVFSGTQLSDRQLSRLGVGDRVFFHGLIPSSAVPVALAESDILIHVEAFDRASRVVTRLSISTKIPEYMAARRAILAIGPREIASIQYLQEMRAAKVVSRVNATVLDNAVFELVKDPGVRLHYAEQALRTARRNHDAENIRPVFWATLRSIASAG